MSDWVEILRGFTKFNFKAKKLCLLTQFSRRFWAVALVRGQVFGAKQIRPLNKPCKKISSNRLFRAFLNVTRPCAKTKHSRMKCLGRRRSPHYTGILVWPNFCCTLSHILQGLPLCSRPITSHIKNFRSCVQLSKRCQKLQNFDFQSQFSMSKIIRIFPFFFSLNNINLGAHFLLLTFFDNFNF